MLIDIGGLLEAVRGTPARSRGTRDSRSMPDSPCHVRPALLIASVPVPAVIVGSTDLAVRQHTAHRWRDWNGGLYSVGRRRGLIRPRMWWSWSAKPQAARTPSASGDRPPGAPAT